MLHCVRRDRRFLWQAARFLGSGSLRSHLYDLLLRLPLARGNVVRRPDELAPQPVAYPAPVVYPHRYHRPYHYRRW